MRLSVFLPLYVFFAFAFGQQQSVRISADSLRRHMTILADDALQGRGIGTPGCDATAHYIKNALVSSGIRPVKNVPSYLQTFPVHGSRPLDGTDLTVFTREGETLLRLYDDYLLYSGGAQTFIPAPVRMVFAGYGIIAPEFGYDDYKNIDVQNAVVLFLSGEPVSDDESYFDGERGTLHSSFTLKQKTALARGARGSILIPNPADREMSDWEGHRREFLFEEARLLVTPSENLNAMINPSRAPLLFAGSGYSFDDVSRYDKSGRMRSFPLAATMRFQGKFRERDFLSSNVIGMIEGSDPALRESYVLLSAHYDHLGIGPAVEGDSIYNGLFDNASGVSALLEIARAIGAGSEKPRRSILFLFLTGEEKGFLGSQYYCLNPIIPLHKTVANVNIDGLSMFERIRSVIGVGTEYSTMGAYLYSVVTPLGVTMEEIPAEIFRRDQFRNSDQFMFAQAGIPSLLVSEGLQYEKSSYEEGIRRYTEWSDRIYHSPFDDIRQSVNFDAAVQHTELLLRLALAIAGSNGEPQWFENSPFSAERARTVKEKR